MLTVSQRREVVGRLVDDCLADIPVVSAGAEDAIQIQDALQRCLDALLGLEAQRHPAPPPVADRAEPAPQGRRGIRLAPEDAP